MYNLGIRALHLVSLESSYGRHNVLKCTVLGSFICMTEILPNPTQSTIVALFVLFPLCISSFTCTGTTQNCAMSQLNIT